MRLKRFPKMFSRETTRFVYGAISRMRDWGRKWHDIVRVLDELWSGCFLLERNLNTLEERVAELEKDKDG